MTDIVVISDGRPAGDDLFATMQAFINSAADWVHPTGSTYLADRYEARPEYDLNIAALESGAFGIQNSSGSSLDVTIEPGEAVVGGSIVISDTAKTVTVPASVTDEPIYIGWDTASQDETTVGTAGDFTDDWLTCEIHRVTTDDTGVTGTTDARPLGKGNARRRDDLSLDQFDEDVTFNGTATFNSTVELLSQFNANGRELSQVKLWQWSGVPNWQPPRQFWVNTSAESGKDEVQGFFYDRNGSLQRYRVPLQRVVPTIEDWESGNAGARWDVDSDHNIASPGLNGSQYRLQLDGFGDTVSTPSLPNQPRPGEWLRFYWQFEGYHNNDQVSAAVFQFGEDAASNGQCYEVFIAHRPGQTELVGLRNKSGSGVEGLVRFEDVSYFEIGQEYRFDIYWPDGSGEDWVAEIYENGSLRNEGIRNSNSTDPGYGAGGIRLNNPAGADGVTWSFDELHIPARNPPGT